ncbi:hypothetical protein BHC44_09690 [Snodgrassella alvi]|uniref:Uncharacterized protein n=1 Tax=Snodgrassella alvi TaxID=1196083 RepID=A0A2N9XW28_9NEIS|nr:hypothetical protein [Snodgrassella alvi]PIT51871.1 hypothetical protein BHC44_09690 [Snodgrassella alvi]PIT53874.1 hypothetical protein BHC49_09255 [Snodgrassella alvi]
MLSKCSIDAAEDVLKAYERAMRDVVRQGHCRSIEWKYRSGIDKNKTTFILRYPPEVFDMVKRALFKIANTNREAFAILRIQYAYISPYFKRSGREVVQKNQRTRKNSSTWYRDVERALIVFWDYLQHDQNFNKYFK